MYKCNIYFINYIYKVKKKLVNKIVIITFIGQYLHVKLDIYSNNN